jgi:hypothetical protein
MLVSKKSQTKAIEATHCKLDFFLGGGGRVSPSESFSSRINRCKGFCWPKMGGAFPGSACERIGRRRFFFAAASSLLLLFRGGMYTRLGSVRRRGVAGCDCFGNVTAAAAAKATSRPC